MFLTKNKTIWRKAKNCHYLYQVIVATWYIQKDAVSFCSLYPCSLTNTPSSWGSVCKKKKKAVPDSRQCFTSHELPGLFFFWTLGFFTHTHVSSSAPAPGRSLGPKGYVTSLLSGPSKTFHLPALGRAYSDFGHWLLMKILPVSPLLTNENIEPPTQAPPWPEAETMFHPFHLLPRVGSVLPLTSHNHPVSSCLCASARPVCPPPGVFIEKLC